MKRESWDLVQNVMISWNWTEGSTPRDTCFHVRRNSDTGNIELVISNIGNTGGSSEEEILKALLKYYSWISEKTHAEFNVKVLNGIVDDTFFEKLGFCFIEEKKTGNSKEDVVRSFKYQA